MSARGSILVAGAGAVGLTCALRLAEAGFTVTLADLGGPNASSVAAGMLAPAFESVMDPGTAEHFSLLLEARDLWPDLAARIGLDLDRHGALAVGSHDAVDRWGSALEALGAEALRLTPHEAWRRQPALTLDAPAVVTPDDWRIDPIEAIARLSAACARAGVIRRAARVRAGEGPMVACSGWATDLAPELAALTPIKGQIVRLLGAPLAGPVIRAEGFYIAPASGGACVGATMERGRTDIATDPAVVGRFIDGAIGVAAGLSEGVAKGQAGIRAATPDGLPLVGRSRVEGVIVAAGTRRNGWLLAPLIAEEVVRAARGEEPGPRAARFAPGRFA